MLSSTAQHLALSHRDHPDEGPFVLPFSAAQRQREALPQGLAGLIFDMGDVLYDTTVWRRWLLRILARLGIHSGYREFFHLWDRAYLPAVHCGRCTFDDAFRRFLSAAGLSAAQVDEVAAACHARRRAVEAEARPLPGVRSTIARLHAAGVPMAVLSDTDRPGESLRAQTDRFGLQGAFRAVISSLDLRRIKPDPAAYLAALAALELPARQVAFVGHDSEELRGAAEVGLVTVAFNYDPEARADVFLARFDGLLELLLGRAVLAAVG